MGFSFIVPTEIIFEYGTISYLPSKLESLEVEKPLLVTSRGMVEREFAQDIFSSLKFAGLAYQIYNQIKPEPSIVDAEDCLQFAKERGCDSVIGLGGGSVMDVAKKVAMDLEVPKIMIPTTAGTGSEVTHEAVLKVEGKKRAFVDARLTPDIAIIAPELSMTMLPRLAASSGIDALSHAIESHDSRRANPLVKPLAYQAYIIIKANLEKAIYGEREARINMALGSLMAGIAFGNSGTTLAHALSYPLSNEGTPHGEAVAMMLPYALEFNNFDEDLIKEVKRITKDQGLYPKFGSDIQDMAKVVMEDRRHLSNNPREVTLEDVINIFERARSEGHNISRR